MNDGLVCLREASTLHAAQRREALQTSPLVFGAPIPYSPGLGASTPNGGTKHPATCLSLPVWGLPPLKLPCFRGSHPPSSPGLGVRSLDLGLPFPQAPSWGPSSPGLGALTF
jgi:hypothetical protein